MDQPPLSFGCSDRKDKRGNNSREGWECNGLNCEAFGGLTWFGKARVYLYGSRLIIISGLFVESWKSGVFRLVSNYVSLREKF